MNEDSMYDSEDEHALAIRVLDEFLSSNGETLPVTDETYTLEASRPPIREAGHLDGHNTLGLSSFVTIPEVMNNTAVQTSGVGPLKIIPIKDNCCYPTKQMRVQSNILHCSTTNDCQHSTTILPSTGDSQSLPMINYQSPSLPVVDHNKESTSYQIMDSIPPQFQFSQQVQQGHTSIMQHDINNITPQEWLSEPSTKSNKPPYNTFIADPMTTPPSSSSAVQSNSMWTTSITSNDHQSQNTVNSYELVSGNSLVSRVQVYPIQTMNYLGQQNINLIVGKPIKYEVLEDNKTFPWQQILKEHNILNTADKPKWFPDEEPFECNQCGKKFRLKENLMKHYIIHTDEEPFECNICHKRFKWKCSLNKHCLIHTGEKPFECNLCGKKFRLKENLIQHLVIHTDEEPFECNICHKRFKWKCNLKKHCLIHTGEKPFECNLCGEKFRLKAKLIKHLVIHTGEELFECTVCHNRFNRKSNLHRHYLTHSSEKPFK